MRKPFAFVILFALFTCEALSQTILTGHVLNEKKEPVFNASVVLMRVTDSLPLSYTFTDDKGHYKLITENKEEKWLLTVYGFNIGRQSKIIENKSQVVDFNVAEQAIQIREVSVKSEKIWGGNDTVNYVVDAFRDTTDIVIADVLKKMPGIEVKDDGKVEYKGKPISKFYIENMDMLQGRYNLATNSIAASDVASVQVMENHQEVRALQNIQFSDNVALNIKLKENAKGTFALMADLGAGWADSLQYEGGLTGMYFAKRNQFLGTLKANNSGINLVDNENVTVYPMASMVKPSAPSISSSRYALNRSQGVTLNSLHKLKNEAELSYNLLFGGDRNRRSSESRTLYLLPNDTLNLVERMQSMETAKMLEGSINYNLNKDLDYLKISLTASGHRNWGEGLVDNGELIRPEEDYPSLCAKANIHWIRKSRRDPESGVEINSTTSYGTLPYGMQVEPGCFPEVLNSGEDYALTMQNIGFQSFKSENSLRFLTSMVWKRLRIMPYFNFNVEEQSLNSDALCVIASEAKQSRQETSSLECFVVSPRNDGNLFSNDIRWHKYQPAAGAWFTYDRRRVSVTLVVPVQLRYLQLDDRIETASDKQFKVLSQPSLSFRYDFSHKWKVSTKIATYNNTPSLRTLYSGYILQNYRTLSRYDCPLADTYGTNGSLTFSYKNVMKYAFGDFSVNYNRYRNEVMYAQSFEGNTMVINAVEQQSWGDYLSVSLYAGKGFSWKRLNINAKCSYGLGRSPHLVQNQVATYYNQAWNVNLTASIAITDYIYFNNKGSFSRMTSSLDGFNADSQPIVSIIDNANLSVVLPFGLSVTPSVEFYHTRSEGRTDNFVLLDCSLGYTFRKVKFTLDVNNILDTDSFVYSYYSGIYGHYSAYSIRPRSVMLGVRLKVI
ncbi:MAG: TonB-dependent receptor [Bacteroidales bacterium]|nr:TonB-dependent receptor [Bacteroidales bacterium]MBQ8959500.1 TonB-dependent receptor [Bacteroidales bacterium]